MTKNVGGRPSKGADALDQIVQTRVSAADLAVLLAWAERAGKPLAVMLRETAMRAAKRGSTIVTAARDTR